MPTNNKNKINLENLVGNTLRWGVWIAFALAAIGLILLLIKSGHIAYHPETLSLEPAKFSFAEMFKGIASFEPSQIAMAGCLVLLLTPLLRVIFAIWAYWKEGNKLYTLISAIVLVIILISVLIGIKH